MQYDFPGNVRELENFIEYAFILCHGSTIEMEHLPKELRNSRRTEVTSTTRSVVKPLAFSEEETIKKALDQHSWNRTSTAAYLGINPSTLWRKMKKYGIKS